MTPQVLRETLAIRLLICILHSKEYCYLTLARNFVHTPGLKVYYPSLRSNLYPTEFDKLAAWYQVGK